MDHYFKWGSLWIPGLKVFSCQAQVVSTTSKVAFSATHPYDDGLGGCFILSFEFLGIYTGMFCFSKKISIPTLMWYVCVVLAFTVMVSYLLILLRFFLLERWRLHWTSISFGANVPSTHMRDTVHGKGTYVVQFFVQAIPPECQKGIDSPKLSCPAVEKEDLWMNNIIHPSINLKRSAEIKFKIFQHIQHTTTTFFLNDHFILKAYVCDQFSTHRQILMVQTASTKNNW